ncbi:hypothetical protein KUTeg_008107, partial [Tegillarca granosa]
MCYAIIKIEGNRRNADFRFFTKPWRLQINKKKLYLEFLHIIIGNSKKLKSLKNQLKFQSEAGQIKRREFVISQNKE